MLDLNEKKKTGKKYRTWKKTGLFLNYKDYEKEVGWKQIFVSMVREAIASNEYPMYSG